MVGRPGISKGCMRCKQRKKGCDLKQPSCGQCSQRGWKCPGYGAGITFVHDSRSAISDQKSHIEYWHSNLSSVTTPLDLIKSATQVGLSDHFWYIYLPQRTVSPASPHGSLNETFQALQNIMSNNAMPKHAFWALSASTIGREVADNRLLQQSLKMYGQALKEMRAAIENVGKGSSRAFINLALTCNLLALYEILSDPGLGQLGFYAHCQGLAELVQFRGPNSFRSGVAWAIFQGARVAIVLTAVHRRRATFLSSEDWCIIPWQIEFKSAWQRVIDVTVKVPELLEEFDRYRCVTLYEEKHAQGLRLLDHCSLLVRALEDCYSELPSFFGLESCHELWCAKQSSHIDSPFATEVHFENDSRSQALTLYWATSLLVYTTIEKVGNDLKSIPQLAHSLELVNCGLPAHPNTFSVAVRIVKSVPFFLRPGVGILMKKVFAVPLAIAYGYFACLPRRGTEACSLLKYELTTSSIEYNTGAATSASDATLNHEYVDAEDIQSYIETYSKAFYVSPPAVWHSQLYVYGQVM